MMRSSRQNVRQNSRSSAFTTYANNPGVTNAATANGISPSAALSGPLPHARWAKNPGN
jgi:hypothetical protein